jgi:transcriptional regulator with XRE-family HTH domain
VARKHKPPDLEGQLREAIAGSKMSLNQLARESGVHAAQLSRFMRGERSLTLKAAAKVCACLGWQLAPLVSPEREE